MYSGWATASFTASTKLLKNVTSLYFTSVVPSATTLVSMEANGATYKVSLLKKTMPYYTEISIVFK